MSMATFDSWKADLSTNRVDWRDLLFLLLFALLLFAPGINGRDLWDPDEPRYTQVASEMLETGQFFVPHVNDEIYAHKPPLLFWLMCLASIPFGGISPGVARIPILLSAAGSLMAVYCIGCFLLGRRHGLVMAVVFATSNRILWQGRAAQIDMLLICLVAIAVAIWARDAMSDRSHLSAWFYVVAGLATLAKGPVGLLIPLFALIAFHSAADQRHNLRWLRIGSGLLIWAGVVLAWLVPAAFAGGMEYFQTIVFKQNVTRYAASWHHFRPWYYYLQTVAGDFLPWTVLLPAAAAVGLKKVQGRQREAFLFGLAWIVTTVVFFSMSYGKRSVYMLPAFPALAIMVAVVIEYARSEWLRLRRGLTISTLVLAALWGAAIAFAGLLPTLARSNREAAEIMVDLAPMGTDFPYLVAVALVPLLVAALVATWAIRRGRLYTTVGALASGMAVFAWLGVALLIPRVDVIKTAVPLSQRVLAEVDPEEPLAIFDSLEARYRYHIGRHLIVLESLAELRGYINRPDLVWLLARKEEWAKWVDRLPPVHEVARDAEPDGGYILLANRRP